MAVSKQEGKDRLAFAYAFLLRMYSHGAIKMISIRLNGAGYVNSSGARIIPTVLSAKYAKYSAAASSTTYSHALVSWMSGNNNIGHDIHHRTQTRRGK